MGQGEHFSRVCERHWPLARRVEGSEEEDEEGDETEVGPVFLGNVEAETGCQESPCHLWEGEDQQSSSTPGIDGPNGGERKDEVDKTETE